MAASSAQRKAVTSVLAVSWPPVILQRKTRAMMQRQSVAFQAGFLADLPAQAVVDGLAEFQDAARGFPMVVVAARDEQRAAVVIGDDAADADRMPGRLVVHKITSRVSYRHRRVDELGLT